MTSLGCVAMIRRYGIFALLILLAMGVALPSIAQDYTSDCLSYNPENLTIVDEGSSGWLLTDGVSRMVMLDNEADARNALALARRHTAHCFLGRDTQRPNRSTYVNEFWLGDSGISTTMVNEDCIAYDPNNLAIIDENESGWLLTDGRSRMVMLDNETDARAMLAYAQGNDRQCFIGRGNSRSNRMGYIMDYWSGSGSPEDRFTGVWVNEDPNTGGITQVSFRTGRNVKYVHMWGACTPQDCDWDEEETTLADTEDGVISITWDQGFAIRHQLLFFLPDGRLVVHGFTYYMDDRADRSSTNYFVRQ